MKDKIVIGLVVLMLVVSAAACKVEHRSEVPPGGQPPVTAIGWR